MDELLTDHDDPEKRIAALERQHGGATSRRFVASAAPPSTKQMMKYTYVLMFGAMASLGAIYMALYLIGALVGSDAVMQVGGAVVFFTFLLGAMPAFAMFRRRMNREKTVLFDVGSGGLTVSTKPGAVFSLGDVQLGRWTLEGYGGLTKGTALHLQSGGRDRFILGGRDHRIGAETPLEAQPVDSVDASMSASDFDELLAVVGGPRGLEVHPATPGQPTRCLLTPNPARMFSSSIFGMFKNTATAMRMNANPPKSSVAIDVGEDAISVIDLTSDARIASVPLTQVTATPAASTRSVPRMGVLTMAVLDVRAPDAEPLTIGCPDWAGPPDATWSGGTKLTYRFAWRGEVPAADEPAFVVSDLDWLTLVEKFGLASRLEDRADAGGAPAPGGSPLARPKRKLWIYGAVFAGIMFIVAPAMMLVAGGIMNSHQRDADRLKAEGEKPFALPFTGLRAPHGVAVDAAGNVYVSDSHTQRVLKLSAGSNTQTVLPFTGLDLCSNNIEAATGGLAVDAAGSVYVADSCNNRVVKLAAGSSTQTVLPFRGLSFPQGVAVDSAGAVYALDHSGGRILKVAAGASAQTVLPKAGLAGPTGDVAVDTTGNVYASCGRGRSARSCLLRLAPGSDSWVRLPSAPDHSADTFSSGEQTVAVDAAGNVYMIATRAVLKLAPGSETWTALPGAPSLVDPLGLAADTRGNVYVTDHVGSRATGSGLPWEKDDAVGFVLRLPAG